ncbi:FAD-dependent oxidoreductase [Paracoccus sp. p4-l81]|uniref:FAD-dependent oxidoreductase n=1 Tax=unclassified Paracoccus (in: a-proteobacteria) TaxID=2688777 RepID=UPI0035B796B8
MTGALRGRPVTIIGGGIGGLTAARALALRGAHVTLIEQADALREVGAGLQLSPNGIRVLKALGLDEGLAAIAPRSQAIELLNGETGDRVARLDLLAHRPDEAFRVAWRPRLIDLLAQGARDAGVQVILGQRLDHADFGPDGVTLTMAGGVTHHAPLVIGADGLHSILRPLAAGSPQPRPFFTGQVAWRAVIPAAASEPVVPQVFMGRGRHLVSYPMGHGLRNIVAVEERRDWVEESWNLTDDPLTLRAAFRDFRGPVPGWLAQVDSCYLWGLFRHPVAARWGRVEGGGAVAILGDAAHPTLPFLAQGAVMAMEDAWVLASMLDRHTDPAQAIEAYQIARRHRCQEIVEAANRNARNYHLTGLPRLAGHAGLRLISALAPGKLLDRFDWVYDYDPTAI